MKTAVQFGAGNIGRGFMGQLFWEIGYRIIFVDSNEKLVALLNERKRYTLRILDAATQKEVDYRITGFEALMSRDKEKVCEAIAEADIMCTAVGVKSLPEVAPLFADGIGSRKARNPAPVDIWLCENSLDAPRILKNEILRYTEHGIEEWILQNIGFVGTAVKRIVPSSSMRLEAGDPLIVISDAYHKLPYDGEAIRASPPPIEGIRAVVNFTAEMKKKIFTYNLAHAALGYLGYLKGYTYIHEAFRDSEIAGSIDKVLDEITDALIRRYPDNINREEQSEIKEDIKLRFSNPLIKDTIKRVGKDPIRKLGPEERLVGSALLCVSEDIFPEHISYVCAAALCYDDNEDPDTIRMREMISKNGVAYALKEISAVDPSSKLGKRIIHYYQVCKDSKSG